MDIHMAAVVNDGVVTNVVVVEPVEIPVHKEALGCDYLIAVTDDVMIGDTYDETKSIFLRDGVRVYPEKTVEERLAELEAQVNKMNGGET